MAWQFFLHLRDGRRLALHREIDAEGRRGDARRNAEP